MSLAVLQSSDVEEITHREAMRKLLTDDVLSDLTLQSSVDGTMVRASRNILAARSPVFHKMLYGSFAEARQDVVQVGCQGPALQAMVKYIYTDTTKLLDTEYARNCIQESSNRDEEVAALVHELVSTASTAVYFQLPTLCKKIQDLTLTMIRNWPPVACTFWMECRTQAPDMHCSVVEKCALGAIRAKPKEILKGGALLSLSASMLKEIVRDDKIVADELHMFQCIQSWAKGNSRQHDAAGENTAAGIDQVERQEHAAKLIQQHIRLERIEPADLSSVVQHSGLVTSKQLLDAFQTQALEAHQEHGISYKKLRSSSSTSDEIVMSGAGNPAVNGLYTQDGCFGNACRYSMQGRYNNEPHTFSLFHCSVSNNTKHWYISIVPRNSRPGTSHDIDFYSAPVLDSCLEYPPANSWTDSDEGRDPPPNLMFIV